MADPGIRLFAASEAPDGEQYLTSGDFRGMVITGGKAAGHPVCDGILQGMRLQGTNDRWADYDITGDVATWEHSGCLLVPGLVLGTGYRYRVGKN